MSLGAYRAVTKPFMRPPLAELKSALLIKSSWLSTISPLKVNVDALAAVMRTNLLGEENNVKLLNMRNTKAEIKNSKNEF
jgi:hypothetical protein